MIRQTLAIMGMFITSTLMAQYTIRLEIKSLPDYHPEGSDIYLAGSFNGWNAQDTSHRFVNDEKGNYFIILALDKGDYEYKITRGGWDKTECKKDGTSIDNHILKVDDNEIIPLYIEEWSDRFPGKAKTSTASKNVHIIDTSFFIPQLKRTRRIWIYLPEDYGTADNRYPVLYMQDGQNVFDDATAFAGEWGVDEYLDSSSAKKCIVVAVDNSSANRMTEYNPYDYEKFGKGEGNKYADFLVKTLKPFIDKNYRTLKSKDNTFIAGSSMGGLISFYCLLKYPGTFGGAGIFSPSFWVAPAINKDVLKKGHTINSKIYFYCGEQEGESMAQDMMNVVERLRKVSKSTITSVIRTDGKHNEATWRKEFPVFYNWIMK
ncbi:MAG: alpha/beta hydrolase-fold protein [Bacteroidota bacterium]